MIKFQDTKGRVVHINPQHCTSVTQEHLGDVLVHMAGGTVWKVDRAEYNRRLSQELGTRRFS